MARSVSAPPGRRKLTTIAVPPCTRMGTKLAESIMTASDEQTVTLSGTTAADTALPRLVEALKSVLTLRKTVVGEVEDMLDAHPFPGS
jgi:hypothetical protein